MTGVSKVYILVIIPMPICQCKAWCDGDTGWGVLKEDEDSETLRRYSNARLCPCHCRVWVSRLPHGGSNFRWGGRGLPNISEKKGYVLTKGSKFLGIYPDDLVVICIGNTATVPVAGKKVNKIIGANNHVS